jgi:YVTN family beta-propeller protein
VMLSLGWFLFESCDCHEESQSVPDIIENWVTCIGNKPTLMYREGLGPALPAPEQSNLDVDCTHPNSPQARKSASPLLRLGTPTGPLSVRKAHAAGSGTPAVFLPRQLRSLPFIPPIPPPATPPGCDSSFPDVLQTVHTNALVTRFSTCPFQIKATIPVVSRPLQVEITPDGATALVTSFDNAVNFIDLATNQVTFTLMTDPSINPNGIAISPDGARAYVTSFNINNPVVLVIDLASRKVVASIPTIQYPQGAILTPDGSQLWVTSPLASSVDVIDTLTNTAVTGLGIGQTTDVAFNSTGTRAYVTSASNSPGNVVVVDTATYRVIKSYTVGQGPADIARFWLSTTGLAIRYPSSICSQTPW